MITRIPGASPCAGRSCSLRDRNRPWLDHGSPRAAPCDGPGAGFRDRANCSGPHDGDGVISWQRRIADFTVIGHADQSWQHVLVFGEVMDHRFPRRGL